MNGRAVMLFVALLAASQPVAAKTHRSHEVPKQFMHAHPCPGGPDAGHTRGQCRGYIRDHIVALCRGGADSVGNMQWQTVAEAKAKDRWECRR
jgi:hypothetical protein